MLFFTTFLNVTTPKTLHKFNWSNVKYTCTLSPSHYEKLLGTSKNTRTYEGTPSNNRNNNEDRNEPITAFQRAINSDT